MHTLSRTPGIDIRMGNVGLRPLLFAAAVIATVEDGENDGEGSKTDDKNDKHDYPFPVSGEPAY